MRVGRAIVSLLIASLFTLPAGHAVARGFDPARPGTFLEQAKADARKILAGRVSSEAVERQASKQMLEEPSFTPSATQTGAPSGSGLASALVNRADFSSLLSAALDNALGVANEEKAITIGFDFFALVAAADSTVLLRNEDYARYSGLRRFAGSVTLGGMRDESAADTSTTGPTASPRSRSLTDIVTVQGKWRILGSRDRRDHWVGPHGYMALLAPAQQRVSDAMKPIVTEAALEATRAKSDTARYEVYLRSFLENPSLLTQLHEAESAFQGELSALNAEIDRSFLLTLSVSGDFRDSTLGKDKFYAELIADGHRGLDLTGNLSLRSDEVVRGRHDRELRLGLAVSKKVLRGSPILADGFDVSFGVSGRMRNSDRSSVWSMNGKFDFPVQQTGLKLSTSVTWSNHSDLIQEREIRGNFGLSYDLSALRPRIE